MKRIIAALLLALGAAGCAPQLTGAVKVGNREPATWVFIASQDKDAQGIYRCRDTDTGPVCTRAKMND
jgi:hypothetical protein